MPVCQRNHTDAISPRFAQNFWEHGLVACWQQASPYSPGARSSTSYAYQTPLLPFDLVHQLIDNDAEHLS